jgi:hypothetical protein
MKKINSVFKEKSDDKIKDLKGVNQIFEKSYSLSTTSCSSESKASTCASVDNEAI